MPLRYPPKPGQILICDFRGYLEPEITKKRPVVVVSPRSRSDRICSVVPVTHSAPMPLMEYHYLLPPSSIPIPGEEDRDQWVKCNLISTVSLDRLHYIGLGKDESGKRKYFYNRLENRCIEAIRDCVKFALGMK